jgi:hypothetical protein
MTLRRNEKNAQIGRLPFEAGSRKEWDADERGFDG